MEDELVDIVLRGRARLNSLLALAHVKGWNETVTSTITPAVYNAETGELITPAVTETIPNPKTFNMWLDEFAGSIFSKEIIEPAEKLAIEAATNPVREQFKSLKNEIKSSVTAEITPVA